MALIDTFLSRVIRKGQFTLVHADGSSRTFGVADPAFPDVTLRLNDRSVGRVIVLLPSLGFA
ncbi:MAG: SAM-dependent methyltransferase, partial [Sphingobium sp.]